jgi:integrase
MADRLSAGTVQVIVSHLRAMLDDAVRDGLLETNPIAGVRVPRIDRTLVVPPTVEQLRSISDRLPLRYRALVAVCAGTGMRQGECFGLTLDRVDVAQRSIRIDRQLVTVYRNAPTFGPPKTRASVRTIPLTDRTLELIRQQAANYPNRLGLIFSNPKGEPIDRTRFSEEWRPAAASVGLPPRTGMHCLRHFYASLLIRSGCSVKVVQARLGHATASETLDTYAHLWPDDHDQTRAAIDGLTL